MKNYSKMVSCLASFIAMGALWTGPAMAQNSGNLQLQSIGVMEKFSATDVASMLKDFEIEIQLQPYQNDESAALVAVVSSGAQFYISMYQCDDVANGIGCQQALVFTGISNAGLAYEDLNNFNTISEVTRAIYLAEQQLVLFGTKIFAQGGIGRGNFQLLIALFLTDMQKYVDSQTSAANTIALTLPSSSAGSSKITSVAPAVIHVPDLADSTREYALKAAISNTWNVEFLTEEAAKFVD